MGTGRRKVTRTAAETLRRVKDLLAKRIERHATVQQALARQLDFTSILRGLASSAFGRISVMTPSRISALILS
jgi:hypothetical protein